MIVISKKIRLNQEQLHHTTEEHLIHPYKHLMLKAELLKSKERQKEE